MLNTNSLNTKSCNPSLKHNPFYTRISDPSVSTNPIHTRISGPGPNSIMLQYVTPASSLLHIKTSNAFLNYNPIYSKICNLPQPYPYPF